jgi:hypothetical protein
MKTYTAHFRTDANFATREFKAATPEQALKKARRFYADDPLDLMFESYSDGMPVNEIVIQDADDNELAVWLDDDLRLRLAASDLLESLSDLVAQIQELRGESSCIDEDLLHGDAFTACVAAIAKAKGGAA